ncbi:hypothetical protein TYRP_002760, partial [Tyrophagus putrescentiae]
CCYRYR